GGKGIFPPARGGRRPGAAFPGDFPRTQQPAHPSRSGFQQKVRGGADQKRRHAGAGTAGPKPVDKAPKRGGPRPPGGRSALWWTTREIAAPTVPNEVRFLSDVKTLVSVGESDLRIAALADITVVQGEPTEFSLAIPEGYEVAGATGATVETAETQNNTLVLKLGSSAARSHQFLISMEKPISDSKTDVPFLSLT